MIVVSPHKYVFQLKVKYKPITADGQLGALYMMSKVTSRFLTLPSGIKRESSPEEFTPQFSIMYGWDPSYMTVPSHRISRGIIYTTENTPFMKAVYRSPKYPNNMK